MSREIEGSPETLEDAIYLLDRGQLPADLQKVVSGARSREQAVHRLTDSFDEDADEQVFGVDYSEKTNDELREELRQRNLSDEGKKAELIERLEESDLEPDAEPES